MVADRPSKIDFEEFKKAMKELTLEDMLPVVLSTADFLKNFGNFVIAIGGIQKKSDRASEMFSKIGEEPQAFLTLLVDKLPEDKLKPLVELSLRLSALQEGIKDFKTLSADEKIQAGEEFKQIADDIVKMFKQVKT